MIPATVPIPGPSSLLPTSLSGHSAALPGRISFTPDLQLWASLFGFPFFLTGTILRAFLGFSQVGLLSFESDFNSSSQQEQREASARGPAPLAPGLAPPWLRALYCLKSPSRSPAQPAAVGLPRLLLRVWSSLLGTLSQPGTPAPQGLPGPRAVSSSVASLPDKVRAGGCFLRPRCFFLWAGKPASQRALHIKHTAFQGLEPAPRHLSEEH